MFNNGYLESFVDGIERVKNSQDDKEFQRNVNLISDYMKKATNAGGMLAEIRQIIFL